MLGRRPVELAAIVCPDFETKKEVLVPMEMPNRRGLGFCLGDYLWCTFNEKSDVWHSLAMSAYVYLPHELNMCCPMRC